MINKLTTILLGLVATSGLAHAADIYLSPNGADTNTGTQAKPLATFSAARDKARIVAGKEAVTVYVADGIYYLPDTLVFNSTDSGSEKNPVVYKAINEGKAILSGGSELDLTWTAFKDGIYEAKTQEGLEIDQLFIDGKNQRMARYPNYDPVKKAEPYQGYAADAFSKERAALWADPAGGYIHSMHRARWGGYHYLITGKDAKGEITYEGGWQNNRKSSMHAEFRMVENIFEELDASGEWYHNANSNTLYYKPAAETDMQSAKVEVVRLRHLVEFQGSESQPVKHITLQGFTVRHAARTFMDVKEPLLRSDWAIYRGGAYMLTGTENVQILDTEFDQVGGNAVFVNNYNRHVLVKGCHIHDAGASGVCFVGDPNAVRNPLFEYGEKNDLSKIDRAVGPKTNNYPAESAVEDCLIHGIGRVERQPAGVQISMAQDITVRDTSIYDTARAGINISEGTWGGHLIERCDVFDTVLETHDHGSFNSWGRDRYWRSDVQPSQKAVDSDPQLPFVDAMKTTIIRNSRWRCEHGWDIDLDDGSTNYDIYNNVMLSGGLKLREGFRRHAWNNITVKNGLHPHVWYNGSKDQVYSNIFMASHKAARMDKPYIDGTSVDKNFYTISEAAIMRTSKKLGWDENSLYGDPMFIDPENGDFRVKEGSPAFDVGFKNFPMDQFGVKKPSLKAIAKTPSFAPQAKVKVAKKKPSKPTIRNTPSQWLGAKLHTLVGEEFSAFGVSAEEGGVSLKTVQANSTAAKSGLKEADVIQGLNGKKVSSSADLFKALTTAGSKPVKLKLVRNQQPMELTLLTLPYVKIEQQINAELFAELTVPAARKSIITTNERTSNDPLEILTDGKLSNSFGPVFKNGVKHGAYKMDLGAVKSVSSITSWSSGRKGRGIQNFTLYGSNSEKDPGWDLDKLTPLGTIDTSSAVKSPYTAASLVAPDGKSLGSYRWIIWAVSPISPAGGGENTSFQEFSVEIF